MSRTPMGGVERERLRLSLNTRIWGSTGWRGRVLSGTSGVLLATGFVVLSKPGVEAATWLMAGVEGDFNTSGGWNLVLPCNVGFGIQEVGGFQ